jgi:LysM repeat protein
VHPTTPPHSVQTRTVTVAAAKPTKHAATAQSTYYTVRSGDTLATIADSYYGNAGDWQYLYYENEKTVSDPDQLSAGERLLIPATVPTNFTLPNYTPKHAKPTQPATQPVTESTAQSAGQSTSNSTANSTSGGTTEVQTSAQGTYSCSGLEQLWEQAGGNSADAFMAAEISMAESGGNPNAISPTDDYGLWQINASNGALATLNPLQNAKSAITLSADGTNWDAWTTYHSGAYSGKC